MGFARAAASVLANGAAAGYIAVLEKSMNSLPLKVVLSRADAQPDARAPTVLLIAQDQRLVRSTLRVMRASGIEVVICAEPEAAHAWLERTSPDLVVLDLDLLGTAGGRGREPLTRLGLHPRRRPLILLCQEQSPEQLAALLEQPYARNLCAKLGERDPGDLVVTTRKILDNDIFGIDKYLRFGAVIHTHRIAASEERQALLDELESYLSEVQCRERTASQVLTIADELLMNALYDAPTDAAGRHLHARRSRTEPVRLREEQAAEMQFGCDGRFLAIGCRDPFGSLEPGAARASLARGLRRGADQIRSTDGGAGIGVYMMYQYATQLAVNVDPGRATEFVGVVDLTATARQRYEQPRSFNLFVKR